MSNEIPAEVKPAVTPSVTPAAETAKVTLGQWLIQARQASGLSVQEIAQRTNRSVSQITELEADDLSSFGAQALLRGMIRQYAKAVGANEAQALQLIPGQFQSADHLEGIGLQDNLAIPKKTARLGKPGLSRIWIVLLTLLVLGLLAYWVFVARMFHKKDAAQKMSTANQVQVVNPPAPTTPALTVPTAPTTEATPSTPDANATTQTAPTPTVSTDANTNANTDATLGLKFKAPVWIQVKDAKGTVLASGTQPAGSEQNLKGELPLSIVIGDVTGVDMTWKGQPYDLKSAAKGRATVAKINGLE